jgi:hypothetical protein
MQPSVHSVHRLSLNRFALWASALGATVVIGVLSLILATHQPINKTNTATINLPVPSVASGHEDDVLSVEWLTQRNATNSSQPKPLEGAGQRGSCHTTPFPALCP